MKKMILLFTLFYSSQKIISQSQNSSNPFPKTITVTGSAEMEVIPDEIYVNVDLREYQKKGENKKDLEGIKAQFLLSCRNAAIPDSCISIVSYSGFNNYYWLRKNKKRNPDLFASITYQLKFKNSMIMDNLIEQLDDEATQNFMIVSTSHSKITEFRKQLKIQAMKAAKEKGIYLTESIGEKLGAAITINEPDDINLLSANPSSNTNIRIRGVSSLNNYKLDENDSKIQEVDFRKIKLRYEVSVIFSLQ
jgi:hypothetical protein